MIIVHKPNPDGIRPTRDAEFDQITRLAPGRTLLRIHEWAIFRLERGPITPEREALINQFLEADRAQ